MTNEEKTAVENLRKDGYGYKKISQMTGICESTIKSYCRRNRLSGEQAQERHCLCCGKTVIQYPGRKEKKFCSDACRNKWWNSHLHLVKRKAMYDYVCPVCGKAFTAYGNRNRKYCSHACYIEDRFGGAACG